MPIFELENKSLVPFKRQAISTGVYEQEIEDLLWDNLEELTGDNLFRVARQAILPSGGKPDVLALDKAGRVVVIEVKRDVDRGQLAQTLEYAGWARVTNLDQLAGMYHGGAAAFWDDWKEFTDSATPVLVQRDPRLVLVARSFDERTFEALQFLLQHKLPIQVLKVAFYIDEDAQRRILNVEWETEPESVDAAGKAADGTSRTDDGADDRGYLQVTLSEVAEAVSVPAELIWKRPKKQQEYQATLLPGGVIKVSDGREFRSPSGAAMAVAEVVSYDGWYAWRLVTTGRTLNDHRHELAAHAAATVEPVSEGPSSSESNG